MSSDLEVIKTCSTTQQVPSQSLVSTAVESAYSNNLVEQLMQSYQMCLSEVPGGSPVSAVRLGSLRPEKGMKQPVVEHEVHDTSDLR